MPRSWSVAAAQEFWSSRSVNLVLSQNVERTTTEDDDSTARATRDEQQRLQFNNTYENFLSTDTNANIQRDITTANDLNFWATYRSWTFCEHCGSVQKLKLLPSYQNKSPVKTAKTCQCREIRYIVPCIENIPDCLKNLTYRDIVALRPVDLHVGDYKRLKHGYRQKTNMCRITWSNLSPQEKIDAIDSQSTRTKLLAVYRFLMSSKQSAYSRYVKQRERDISTEKRFNMYMMEKSQAIECALWPHLYPKESWCDTVIKGNTSRLSFKVAFLTKVLSGISDYAMDYELLQFHYDLWLFKTVSGAISTARKMHCSPARALNAKTFSPGYWKMQHRLLQDAVDQYGYPSLFLTISPYEWTFPMAEWVTNMRHAIGKNPTELAGFETIHIAHTLEQVIRGYLCGSNTNKWNKHVFNYEGLEHYTNVNTYFYRFEFQQRGTLHVHLLVWLDNFKRIQHNLIKADIPWENPDLAFLVYKLQQSDKSALPYNDNPTTFAKVNGKDILQLYHPQEAFALNLRCYLSSLLPALRCRMDLQFSDGNDMLLRYVSSYVSKNSDGYTNDRLFSRLTSPFQAAYRHIKDMNVCEPEMWMSMSSIKISWTCSRTKEYCPPSSDKVCENSIHNKYLKRTKDAEDLSFLQWLRNYQHTIAKPKRYKSGNTLVSVRYRTAFNDEFFFQDLLMNHPHRTLQQLFIPNYEQLPEQFRYFSCAVANRASEWADVNAAKTHFEKLGHRDYYINNLLSHIQSLLDILKLWQRQVLNKTNFIECLNPADVHPLDEHQRAIFRRITHSMTCRNDYYSSADEYTDVSDDEDIDLLLESEETSEDEATSSSTPLPTVDWKKFILISGEAGTGKSQIIFRTVEWSLENDIQVLIATPTALLAMKYRNTFGEDVVSETVHSIFFYPVDDESKPTINWSLSSYDFIFIDEVSMLPRRILQHVVETVSQLPFRPVVVMGGDCQQQQPIETVEGATCSVPSALLDKSFYHLVDQYKLTKQYRVVDPHYNSFLQHIRYWQPSQRLLDSFLNARVLCQEDNPSDKQILQALDQYADATVLTVSRKAAMKVNRILIRNLFSQDTPLASVPCDDSEENIPIYRGMRVMITQNRDKRHGVINGQEGTIYLMEDKTIFIKLGNEGLAALYLITYFHPERGKTTCYPFIPSYALTMAKSQGQNLKKVLLWFDSKRCPPGCAYMALSRVSRAEDLHLLTPIKRNQVIPVTAGYQT